MKTVKVLGTQSKQFPMYKHNTTEYAFVDTDILIVLKALEQRDHNDLDSDTVITMPVSQEDNTLTLKLREIDLLSHAKDFLLPIKVKDRYHWQLIRVSKFDGKIICGVYDTNGKVAQPDANLLDEIQRVIPKVESIDPETCNWHQWDEPAQKNVNCGLVVALMAHQLRLKSTTKQSRQTNYYADFNPKMNDNALRDQVSNTVMQYGNNIDKMVFCTYKPSGTHTLSGISYDADNADQLSVYQACKNLTPDQISHIATIICQHQIDDTRQPLREALSTLPYAGFLFTTDDKNETCWKDQAENTLLYYYREQTNKNFRSTSLDPIQIERTEEQRHDENHKNHAEADQLQLYDTKSGISYNITNQDTSNNPASPSIVSNTQLSDHNTSLLSHYFQYSLENRKKIKEKLQSMLKSDTPYLFSHQADAAVMAWAALSQGKPFLLGDQPGVGKTRTMLATSILYRQTQSQSKKKALIIVNNDAQVNVFRCDMSSYKNFLTDQDDMAIDIKKISEVQKMKDFSNYDLVMVDEVHSMIDGKSIKGEKDGKLNDLLSAIEDKNVLLASATAAKSLEELTSIRPILEHSRSKSKRKRQKKIQYRRND